MGATSGRVIGAVAAGVAAVAVLAGSTPADMITKRSLSLADARKIGAAAEAEAKKNNWKVSIAVVDDGGHLVYFQRIDDTLFASVDIAIGKARTAVSFKRPTKALEDAINTGQNNAILTFPGAVPREGGLPIMADGQMVGGIGVSGVKSSEDAQVAKAGADALLSK